MVRLHRVEDIATEFLVPEAAVLDLAKELQRDGRIHGMLDESSNIFLSISPQEASRIGAEWSSLFTPLAALASTIGLDVDTVRKLVIWLKTNAYCNGFFSTDGNHFAGEKAVRKFVEVTLEETASIKIRHVAERFGLQVEDVASLELTSDERIRYEDRLVSLRLLAKSTEGIILATQRDSLTLTTLSAMIGQDLELVRQLMDKRDLVNLPGWILHGRTILVRSLRWSDLSSTMRISGNVRIGNWDFGPKTVCCVCGLPVEPGEELASCPYCERRGIRTEGHLAHWREWLNVKGTCPMCRKSLNEDDLIR